jgi:hypothetical protein
LEINLHQPMIHRIEKRLFASGQITHFLTGAIVVIAALGCTQPVQAAPEIVVNKKAGDTALRLLVDKPAVGADPASSVLWYGQPARTWMTEALPLGGMFFGLTATGRLGPDGLNYESQLRVLHTGGTVRVDSTPMAPWPACGPATASKWILFGEPGRLESATLRSNASAKARLRYGAQCGELNLRPGESVKLDVNLKRR